MHHVSMTREPSHLTRYQRLELALEACCDERTVVRALRGEPVKSTTARRILRAAIGLGIKLDPIRVQGAGATGSR